MVKVKKSEKIAFEKKDEKLRGLAKKCFPELKVSGLSVFMSITEGANSVLDFGMGIVHLYDRKYFDRANQFAQQYEKILGYEVDLYEEY